MTRRLLCKWGFIGLAVLSLPTDSAWGQTVAPGPYYATPSWDQTLPCATPTSCPRFIVLSNFGGAAVLDRETGLVWERTPMGPDPMLVPPETGKRQWTDANLHCARRTVGTRRGWRLPTVQELASLFDPTGTDSLGRALPAGHPFSGIELEYYWTATSFSPGGAWQVFFKEIFNSSGFPVSINPGSSESLNFVWCVRGGQGVDAQ